MEFQKVLGIFDNKMKTLIQVGRFGGLRHLWVDHAGPHSQVSKNTTQHYMINKHRKNCECCPGHSLLL